MTTLGYSNEAAAPEPPARRKALLGRDMVERVLMQLWTLPPRVKREPLTASLSAALQSLERLAESELAHSDHLEQLDRAVACCGEAAGQLRAADAEPFSGKLARPLDEIADGLKQARAETLERLVSVQSMLLKQFSAKAPPPLQMVPFRASIGLPVLHTLPREPLPLGIRVEPPDDAEDEDDDDDDFDESDEDDESDEEELEARVQALTAGEAPAAAVENDENAPSSLEKMLHEPPAGTAPALAEELGRLRRIARDCMEEMGSLGLLRSAEGPEVAWAEGPEQFEQRMLNDMDALAALSYPFVSISGTGRFDMLAALIEYAGDGFLPDPVRGFAGAFGLGCVAGEDTARTAAVRLRQSHRMTYIAQRDALALAPNPHIGPAVRKICGEGDAALIRIALDILRMRLECTLDVAAPLLAHPDAAVRVAAARCMPLCEPRDGALSLLEQRAAIEDEERVLSGVLESMLRLGSAKALGVLRAKLAEEVMSKGALTLGAKIDAMRLLSIAGDETDAEMLGRLVDKNPLEVNAIGWFGHPGHIPLLIEALEQSEGIGSRVMFAREATRALHRITGLGRREGPILGSLQAVEPPVDSRFWRAKVEGAGERFEKIQRYRFGDAFTPAAVVSEAQAKDVLRDRRVHCELELWILSGGTSRFFVHDWVEKQAIALSSLRDEFGKGKGIGLLPGQWIAGRLGKPAI